MKKKTKILRIINSMNLKFGGPPKAIRDSSINLKENGFEVDILTNDEPGSKYFNHKGIKIINKGPGVGSYGFNLKQFFWLLKNRSKYNFFIVHGLWQFQSFMARLLLRNKFIIYAHGSLGLVFKKYFFKKIKKNLYWMLIEKKNLQSAKALILTSEGEKSVLKNTYVNTDRINKRIINYGSLIPNFNKKKVLKLFYKNFPKLKKKKFLLYLGRIHDGKGCDILINSLHRLKKRNLHPILFMAGRNNSYKTELIKLTKQLKLYNQIIWSDQILGNLKWGAISASSGMLLASHGDSHPNAIVESLSLGKPVIVTNKVGTYKTINQYNCGYVANDNTQDFSLKLISFLKLKKNQLTLLNKNSKKCFNENYNLTKMKNSLSDYLKVMTINK